MKIARKLMLSAALISSILVSAHATPVPSVTDGTYTFQATDGNTALDGSWVKFSGDQITDWSMLDPQGAIDNAWVATFFGPGYLNEFPPLSPSNSTVVDLITYPNGTGPDAFSFKIASPVSATSDSSSQIWYFSGQNNLNNSSALYDGITYNNPIPSDPEGVWTRGSDTVPDTAGTGTLLLGALAAFAPVRRLARR